MAIEIETDRPGREIVLVNPIPGNEVRKYKRWGLRASRFVLAFGAYGDTRLVVWADSLEDALDEAVDYLAEHAPGLLADEQVEEEYARILAELSEKEGEDLEDPQDLENLRSIEEEAREEAEIDTTCAGNEGHYLNSSEWTVICENPSREQMLELLCRA